MDKPIIFGHSRGLQFSLHWEPVEKASPSATEITRGRLLIQLAGRVVWGNRTSKEDVGIDWSWIELLEHLAQSWPRLAWEETDPLAIGELPNRVRPEAERGWENVPEEIRDHQEALVLSFEEAHNLALGLGGIELPGLWILRQGNLCSVMAKDVNTLQPAAEVLATIEALGSQIAERLANSTDPRAMRAISTWGSRRAIPPRVRYAIATGIDDAVLKAIDRGDPKFWGESAEPQLNELMVAARMIGNTLVPSEVRAVLEAIKKTRPINKALLESYSTKLPHFALDAQSKVLANQGYELARKFRELLGNMQRRVDPEAFLASVGIPVRNFDIDTNAVDAICSWGPNHGPAIFVNPLGSHSETPVGRRFTLAHEICHLLIDRAEALPAAEVLGGNVPRYAEARANAFASEFLLPRDIAAEAFSATKNIRGALAKVTKQFGVGKELVAWQVYNSRQITNRAILLFLRQFVGRPMTFFVD
jgi:Zn-dependent peptidase ImmA (M78 family)